LIQGVKLPPTPISVLLIQVGEDAYSPSSESARVPGLGDPPVSTVSAVSFVVIAVVAAGVEFDGVVVDAPACARALRYITYLTMTTVRRQMPASATKL